MGNNLKDIRKQISSVLNTQKTTRAMKLVSTSKLKKADEMARRSKTYANKIVEVLAEIKARVSNGNNAVDNPYFFLENSNFPPKVISKRYKQAEEIEKRW